MYSPFVDKLASLPRGSKNPGFWILNPICPRQLAKHPLYRDLVHPLGNFRSAVNIKRARAGFVCLSYGLESASGAVKGGRIIHNMLTGFDSFGMHEPIYGI